MRHGATDRATIADLIMGDVLDGLREQRMGCFEALVSFDVVPFDLRAKMQAFVVDHDLVETLNLLQVDDEFRSCEAEGHDRHEALAAGHDFRIAGCEESDGLFHSGRGGVTYGRKLHVRLIVSEARKGIVPKSSNFRTNALGRFATRALARRQDQS